MAANPPIQFTDLSDDDNADELVGDDLRELIELTYRDASHLADSYGRLLTSLQVSHELQYPISDSNAVDVDLTRMFNLPDQVHRGHRIDSIAFGRG